MTLFCKQHISFISLNNQNRKGATGLVAKSPSMCAGHQEPQRLRGSLPSREAGRFGKPYKKLEKEKKPIRSRRSRVVEGNDPRKRNDPRKCGNSIRTLSSSGSSAPLSQTTGTLFHSKRRLKRKIILGFPIKINYTYRQINKRFNRRHLSAYLVRRLSIGREYNYRVRKTLLIRNVYKDSVHNISYCNLDQFSKGLLMFLAIHT